jgi:quinol monooxygenase YgiN
MITFIAHVRVNAENAAAFEALMADVCAKVHEHEPGVLYYAVAKSAHDPNLYVVIEVYRDAASQSAHMQTAWVQESLPKASRLMEGKPDIKQYVSPGSEPVPVHWSS